MSLTVTKVNPPQEGPDSYNNISYFVNIAEFPQGGVLVRHKQSSPMLIEGQDAMEQGWASIEMKLSKAGKPYGKLVRGAVTTPPPMGAMPWDPPTSEPPQTVIRPLDAVSRSIAVQASHKVAFEIVALSVGKADAEPLPQQIAEQVRIVTRSLFEQIVELGEDRPVLPS